MRKLVLLLFILFATDSFSQEIIVASWNIRNFSDWSRNDRMLNTTAKILSYYDLVAIQEVKDAKVIHRTIKIMNKLSGKKYHYMISAKVGNIYSSHYERYAFLYDSQIIIPLTRPRLYHDKDDYFFRTPYYCRFRAGNFDFFLITSHIIYSAPKKVNDPWTEDPGA